MRLLTMYLFVVPVAACGTGVDTAPETLGNVGGGSGSGNGDASTSGPCAAPDGPRHNYTTAAELDVLILGKWRQCSGPMPPTLEDSRGIEFVADGRYYVLVDDSEGGLVRATGFSSEGKWDTTQATETEVLFNLRPTPSTSLGDPPLFEDDPRRFAFNPSHAGASSVYVWIGQ